MKPAAGPVPGQYTIERRASLLAQSIGKRIGIISQGLAPSGKRPPFTEQLSQKDAMAWWQKHRFDSLGQQVTANMDPQSLMELDQALGQKTEADQNSALPGEWNGEQP